jgi:integrase
MAKRTAILTVDDVQEIKWQGKNIRMPDGSGLYLHVRKSGCNWELRYKSLKTGKYTFFGLGGHPVISLEKARDLRKYYQLCLSKGIEPNDQKKIDAAELIRNQPMSLNLLVEAFWDDISDQVSENTLKAYKSSLSRYILPKIGNIPIDAITPRLLLKTLSPLEDSGLLSALSKAQMTLNLVFRYAIKKLHIDENPMDRLHKVFKSPKVKHFASVEAPELRVVVETIDRASCYLTTKYALKWNLHTMVRPSETVNAKWCQINWDAKLWEIPAEMMKTGKEHKVPLTKQTIEILNEMKKISGNSEYIFASPYGRSKPIVRDSLSNVLRKGGLAEQIVPHGFRSLASTSANDSGLFELHIPEAALAHVVQHRLGDTYNRATYLAQRVELMEWWSDQIERAENGHVIDKFCDELSMFDINRLLSKSFA